MDERPQPEQVEHDLIIRAAADKFADSEKYQVIINPGLERNVSVGGEHPDIVVTGKGTGKVKFIIEVETASSVDPAEVPQWRRYAALGSPFYLLVPFRMLPIARQLCRGARVECHFGYYAEDEHGTVKIAFRKD